MKIKAKNNKLQNAKVYKDLNQNHKLKRHSQYKKELCIDDQWKKISTKVRSPSAIIRNSEKKILSVDKALLPGPGSYDLDNFGNKRFTFSKKSNRSISKGQIVFARSNTDNPTSKAIRISQTSSRPSLNGRKRCNDQKQHSEQYHSNVINLSVPGITFPRQSRKNLEKIQNKDKVSSPGPSHYQSPNRKSSKNLYSFYRSKKYINESKQLEQKSNIPAPGQYNLSENRKLLKACRFTQAVRLVTEPASIMIPGPGAYCKDGSTLSRKGGTIGKSFHISKTQVTTPGPGFYKDVDLKSIKLRPAAAVYIGCYSRIGKACSQSIQGDRQKCRFSFNHKQAHSSSQDPNLRYSQNVNKSLNRYDSPNGAFKLSKSQNKQLYQQIRDINGSSMRKNQRLSNHMKHFPNMGKVDRSQINKTSIN